MGAEDQVRPQLSVGPQPNFSGAQLNSPQPPGQQPDPGSMPQTASASPQPQPAPTPEPQGGQGGISSPNPFSQSQKPQQEEQTPQQKESKDIDDLVSSISGNKAPKEVKEAPQNHSDEIDSIISGVNGEPQKQDPLAGKQPNESVFSHLIKSLPESVRYTAAQMRAHLGDNPLEQRQAFESMYGPDNVKKMAGKLQFRPDPNGGWKSVDQKLFNGLADWFVFNSLNAAPVIANGLTQAVVAGETGGVGAIAGAGAAGGAVQYGTRQLMKSAINQFSDIPQSSDRMDMVKSAVEEIGGNAIAAPIATGAVSLVKSASNKLVDSILGNSIKDFAEYSTAPDKVFNKAGEQISKLAMVKVGLKQFRDALFPAAEQETSAEFGSWFSGSVDKIHERLGNAVGVIKKEAIALSEKSGQKFNMDNTSSKIEEELNKYGYKVSNETGMMEAPEESNPLLKPGHETALDNLKNYYNQLTGSSAGGGKNLKDVLSDVDLLSSHAAYDSSAPQSTETRNLYRSIRNAAAKDRNSFFDSIFQSGDSESAKTWKGVYDKFSQSADGIANFQASFGSQAEREKLVETLTKSNTADKNEMLDGLKQILGSDSKEWNSLRGEVFNNIVQKNTSTEGIVDSANIAKFMTKPDNSAFVNRMFSPQEKTVLNKMLIEAQKIPTTGVSSASQKTVIEDGVSKIVELSSEPKGIVKQIFSIFGNDKKAIDYLADEGFMNMANKAQGTEMKERILSAMRYTDGARNRMAIVNVPVGREASKKAFVQKYAPRVGSFAEKKMEGLFGDAYNPSMAPEPSPQPQPAQ